MFQNFAAFDQIVNTSVAYPVIGLALIAAGALLIGVPLAVEAVRDRAAFLADALRALGRGEFVAVYGPRRAFALYAAGLTEPRGDSTCFECQAGICDVPSPLPARERLRAAA